MLRRELACAPAEHFQREQRQLLILISMTGRDHFSIAISYEAIRSRRQRRQPLDALHLHRSAEHVAAYNDLINLDVFKFFQHGFERRQVAMNVVKGSYWHNSSSTATSIPVCGTSLTRDVAAE
jgi:hypothetical protein